MSMKKSIAIAVSFIGAASAINGYAFQEITVDDLGALPSDECFYDVTIPALLDKGWIQYAWVRS